MERLNPDKLLVTYLNSESADKLTLPRRYTLTHSDATGNLYLSIGREYNRKQTSGLYTRLMRDEVTAELVQAGDELELRVYCHVSGGLILGTAGWRNNILHHELPLVLEAIRYGDRAVFENKPELENTNVQIHFKSTNKSYNRIENWGKISKYR
jgi:magnesium dechelatase